MAKHPDRSGRVKPMEDADTAPRKTVTRAEHKRSRRRELLRQRAAAGDMKAARMLDQSRVKAGRKQGGTVWK